MSIIDCTVVDGTVPNLSATLELLNDVLAPADSLSGIFDEAGAGSFTLSGFNDFASLDAGLSFYQQPGYLVITMITINFFDISPLSVDIDLNI